MLWATYWGVHGPALGKGYSCCLLLEAVYRSLIYRVWDIHQRQQLQNLSGHTNDINCVAEARLVLVEPETLF
jgi:hypothetical protein